MLTSMFLFRRPQSSQRSVLVLDESHKVPSWSEAVIQGHQYRQRRPLLASTAKLAATAAAQPTVSHRSLGSVEIRDGR